MVAMTKVEKQNLIKLITYRRVGGESLIVGELSSVVYFELEAFPEPKALAASDLLLLFNRLRTIEAVSSLTGLGWSTTYERLNPARTWDKSKKKFLRIKPKKKGT